MNTWRIYKRKGGALRKLSSLGSKDYDGNNWFLHKAYKSKSDAVKAFELLTGRNTFSDGFKLKQFKLIEPGQEPPKTSSR